MKVSIFWFRRDLRLEDNAGLYHALKSPWPVLPLFIFDEEILSKLKDRKDARVSFIHDSLNELKGKLEAIGSSMLVRRGKPNEVWKRLLSEYEVAAVFCNEDYEPFAIARDEEVENMLSEKGIRFESYKDHVIFARDEVLKDDGKPYTVFTPYSKKWRKKMNSRGLGANSFFLKPYPNAKYFGGFLPSTPMEMPTLQEIGFEGSEIVAPSKEVAIGIIRNYDKNRDFPARNGTSGLGVHFRFGTISIREKARKAWDLNSTYVNELIWRDFYATILQHFPHVATQAFRPQYEGIQWRNDKAEFDAWCKGQTGYPLVDAGMRELNTTGYMHNRVRMVVASFLTKHLLINWRWGEAYFAEKLLDFDLASNNGGWQWAAGCGTDAAPYFRIFNPASQLAKFDKELHYVKKWVPEYGTSAYPQPIVDHKAARMRCLATYKEALNRE